MVTAQIRMAAQQDQHKIIKFDLSAKIISVLVGIILSLLCFICMSLVNRVTELSEKMDANAKSTQDKLELVSKDIQEIKVSFATYQEKVKQLEKNDTVKP